MYENVTTEAPLRQGDIVEDCPLLIWKKEQTNWVATNQKARVILLTQSCDLDNAKTSRVQVALVHETDQLVQEGVVKAQTIRDQVRRHRVYGWYFLPAGEAIPESIVDLRHIHTIPREMLEDQVQAGNRLCRFTTPYREHMAQHFAVTYSRVALPEPYETT